MHKETESSSNLRKSATSEDYLPIPKPSAGNFKSWLGYLQLLIQALQNLLLSCSSLFEKAAMDWFRFSRHSCLSKSIMLKLEGLHQTENFKATNQWGLSLYLNLERLCLLGIFTPVPTVPSAYCGGLLLLFFHFELSSQHNTLVQ